MNLEELKRHIDEKFNAQDKLMEERFDSSKELLDQKFKNVESELNHIKQQTTKTNGRVTELERREQELSRLHLDCPVKREFEDYKTHLENDLFIIRFTRRYPRLVYGTLILVAIVVFSGGVTNFVTIIAAIAKAILGI